MDYTCKICSEIIKGNKHFWDNHSIKISEYFHKYEPRFTKDGKSVEFKKDINNYFETDFNSLTERNIWVKANPEIGKEYILDLLIKRKVKKNWIYAPGQTQIRLAGLPSILWFEKEFKLSFREICEKLDFKIKYKNIDIDIKWGESLEIVQDTREQKSLVFPPNFNIVITKLDYGDYALVGVPEIGIERKSISDFAGTLSAGYERFQRELKRAKKDGGYLVILVENSWSDFKSIEYLVQTKHIKSTFDHLAKRARDLYEEFDNFQICFVDGRKQSAKIAELILKLGKKVKKTDLQYLLDSKTI